MKVYKYRSGDNRKKSDTRLTEFDRDLSSIEKNYFWASEFAKLNDPFENTITSEEFVNNCKIIEKVLMKDIKEDFKSFREAVENLLGRVNKAGIYSLSKTHDDELLWAHYANSHKGFCIEYDLDLLLKTYKSTKLYYFPVVYGDAPPKIILKDIISDDTNNKLIHKTTGYKSKKWDYENELRIVIDNFGIHSYDYQAVKSIYFGLRMEESCKIKIMKQLSGRGINYFQIERIPNTYKLKAKKLIDISGAEINYFSQIPALNEGDSLCKFTVIEKNFSIVRKKANIKVELERRISKSQLRWLAIKIKQELFIQANLIGMYYYLKEEVNRDFAYATSHFQNMKYDIIILDV